MRFLTLFATLLVIASPLAAQAAPAATQGTITKLMTLPSDDAEFNAGPVGSQGRFVYYSTKASVKVIDRTTMKTSVVVKGEYSELAVSPSGDRLAMARSAEGATANKGQPTFLWTVPLNTTTGAAAGEPRRLSTLAGTSPAFSADGNRIAFETMGASQRLVVVPATGGVERTVLDNGGHQNSLQWSGDDRWIYYLQEPPGNKGEPALFRVSVDGGNPTPMGMPGMIAIPAPDGQHFVSVNGGSESDLSVSILDQNKKALNNLKFTFDTALGIPCAFGWSGKGLKMLAATFTAGTTLHAQPLPAGADRAIPVNGMFSDPSMSPDDRHIAMRVFGDSNRTQLAIVNADGSNRRLVKTTEAVNPNQDFVWSPDGTHVVFRADNRRVLYVADAATGMATKIGSTEFRFGEARWRADSRAFMYVRYDGTNTRMKVSIHQSSVDGKDHLLRDISSEFPAEGEAWYGITWFFGDSALLNIRLGLVLPITGSGTTHVYDRMMIASDAAAPAVPDDGKWVALPSTDFKTILVISRDGKSRHTLTLPLGVTIDKEVLAHPDGRTLIVGAKGTPSAPPAIYFVPVDGSAPRAVVRLAAGESLDNFSLSHDGRFLIYGRNGKLSVTLVEADLGVGLTGKP